jgi:hypothetical protein
MPTAAHADRAGIGECIHVERQRRDHGEGRDGRESNQSTRHVDTSRQLAGSLAVRFTPE